MSVDLKMAGMRIPTSEGKKSSEPGGSWCISTQWAQPHETIKSANTTIFFGFIITPSPQFNGVKLNYGFMPLDFYFNGHYLSSE
jgi:hypothetical protein